MLIPLLLSNSFLCPTSTSPRLQCNGPNRTENTYAALRETTKRSTATSAFSAFSGVVAPEVSHEGPRLGRLRLFGDLWFFPRTFEADAGRSKAYLAELADN